MRRLVWHLAILPLMVGIAFADAPRQSIRPQPRPVIAAIALPQTGAVLPTVRPQARPQDPGETATTTSAPASNPAKPKATRKGSVCNNPNIKGSALKPIVSRVKGCNVKAPVSVTSINGVRLAPAATINCDEAAALSVWIDNGLQPAFNNQVVQLNIVDSYSCRPRNNVRGGRISEHGAGNAIDISGFVLNTGKTMTVRSNYGAQIKRAQKAACGPFRTTLGPGSDGYHEDHLHLDVSQRGGNPYCH